MDLVVGDFDSLAYVPEHPGVVRLTPEKDDTDAGWALREGLRLGYREFVIYGGTGGRRGELPEGSQEAAEASADPAWVFSV